MCNIHLTDELRSVVNLIHRKAKTFHEDCRVPIFADTFFACPVTDNVQQVVGLGIPFCAKCVLEVRDIMLANNKVRLRFRYVGIEPRLPSITDLISWLNARPAGPTVNYERVIPEDVQDEAGTEEDCCAVCLQRLV
jgi:hypothetical protein